MNDILYDIQETFYDISNNFPNRFLGKMIKKVAFPYGKVYKKTDDNLKKKISDLITDNTKLRNFLKENVYIPTNGNNLDLLVNHFDKILDGDEELIKKICQVDEH